MESSSSPIIMPLYWKCMWSTISSPAFSSTSAATADALVLPGGQASHHIDRERPASVKSKHDGQPEASLDCCAGLSRLPGDVRMPCLDVCEHPAEEQQVAHDHRPALEAHHHRGQVRGRRDLQSQAQTPSARSMVACLGLSVQLLPPSLHPSTHLHHARVQVHCHLGQRPLEVREEGRVVQRPLRCVLHRHMQWNAAHSRISYRICTFREPCPETALAASPRSTTP